MAIPGTHPAVSHPPLVVAFAANAPTALTGTLEVTIPAFGGERSTVLGWVPRESLPVIGDECLVAYDERGDPWVVAWIGAASRALVATLPTSPRDGQEVYYQSAALATPGLVWHLRYRAASASAYKWEFLGGAALHGPFDATTIEVENETYQTGKGPSLVVPLAGDYEYGLTCGMNTTKAECMAAATVKFGTTAAQDVEGVRAQSPVANISNVVSTRAYWRNAIVAGATLEMVYRSANPGKAQFYYRNLWARPIRVG